MLYVDGDLQSKDGKAQQTDADGYYKISVPIGKHYVEAKLDGHTMAMGGRFPYEGTYNFDRAMTYDFADSTLVNFVGRVGGGERNDTLAVGFGASKNNIGIATITLKLNNESFSFNCQNDHITPATMDRSFESDTTSINSNTWAGIGNKSKYIYIRTDSLTGEFSAKLPPLKYITKSVKIDSNPDIQFTSLPEIDLTTVTKTLNDSIKVTKDGKAVSGVYLFVRLYTTSSKYNDYLMQTNSKGQVSFSASLDVGKHKIIVTSADNRYDAKQITKTITVKKASAKITAKKVTTYYNSGNPLVIKLTNTKNKKAIYNAKVKIQISNSKSKYKPITGITGMDGKTRLNLDGLAPGKYKVVLTGADSKNFEAKKVTTTIVIKKAPAKLTPKKLTAKKGAKKYFKVKVKNKKNKKVVKGVKVKIKVYTGKKAKTYTAKTNAKGIAKISTKKLKVGKHKVIVTSADKYVVAKKAKSTIKIKK
jgi:hypothetical protein